MAKNTNITRKQLRTAPATALVISGFPLVANPREFTKDAQGKSSLGWFANGKVPVQLPDGTTVQCQVSCNIVAVGSKDMVEGE